MGRLEGLETGVKRQGGVVAGPNMEVHSSVAERRYCFMPCYGRPEVSV